MIKYSKYIHKDENNRVEFLLCDYSYFNGNDLLAKIFAKNFSMEVSSKFDGIFYSILKVYNSDIEYVFLWHEDIGNSVYCLPQTDKNNSELEYRLSKALEILNKMLG